MVKWLGMIGVAVGLLLGVPLGGAELLASIQSGAPSGELLYLNRGDIWRLDLASNSQTLLVHPPAGIVTRLSHSPDRGQIVYSVLFLDQMYRIQAAEIVASDANGANAQTVVREEEPGFSLGWATFSHEPSKIIYAKENAARRVERVEEVDRATGERTLIVEGGSAPAASPARPQFAYQTRPSLRTTIWTRDRVTGADAELVKAEWFEDADIAVYSPDGSNLAFIAAGPGPTVGSIFPSGLQALSDLVRPEVAAAHDMPGVFFDLWVAPTNGGTPRRVTELFDLQPEITWSPDGRFIASMGALQLQIVDVATGAKTSIPRPNGSGQLSWGGTRVGG